MWPSLLLLLFAGVGAYAISVSRAATPAASMEAENGSRSAAASLMMHASASGGRAIQFSGSTSNGSLTAADLTRLAGLKIYFAHQSVGGNIMQGIPEVYSSYGVSGINLSGANTSGTGGFFADDDVGQNGDPNGKTADFNSKIRSGIGGRVHVALFKFCFVDIYDNTDVQSIFNNYQSTMASLVQTYPNVKFIYVTNPLETTNDAANANRERYNQMIRQAYGSTGRLFDLALVESTQPNGTRVSSSYNGATTYALYSGYSTDGGHLNQVGRDAAAKELLRVIANATR